MGTDKIVAKVFRCDPAKDEHPRYQTYEIPWNEKIVTILDALKYIYDNLDHSLAFRYSCKIEKCGTCTVLVNGLPTPVCSFPAQPEMTIEPLPDFPVVRDLIVDRTSLENRLMPIHLERIPPLTDKPELIEPEAIKELREGRRCIWCFACVVACPVAKIEGSVLKGPIELLKVGNFALDSRDKSSDRLTQSIERGAFDCVSCFKCLEACPHKINSPDIIESLKRKCYIAKTGKGIRHTNAFVELIREKGLVKGSRLFLKTWGTFKFLRSPSWALGLILKGKATIPIQHPIDRLEEVQKIFKREERRK